MKENGKVSLQEVQVFLALQKKWQTAHEIAVAAKAKVVPRTVRNHLLRFVKMGLAEEAPLFREHRYRLASHANVSDLHRLRAAAEMFGLTPRKKKS